MAELRGVSFVAGGQLYALPFQWVTEVLEEPELQPVPEGSDVAGLARVRGRWVPVLPLGPAASSDPEGGARPGAIVIVVGGRVGRLGLLADELRGLVEWTGAWGAAVSGVARAPVTSSVEGVITWIDPVDLIGGREELLSEEGDAMEKTTSPPLTHVVEFRLGDDRFGVNVARVFEVIRYPKVRRLPHTPPFLEGAAELRGAVLPIVDLRKRFGLDPGEPAPETRVLITEVGGERIGLIVDRVLGVTRLTTEELQAAPKFFKGLAARYLEAMVNREGHQTIVLNTDQILTSKEKIQLRGAARPASAPPPPDETEEDSG